MKRYMTLATFNFINEKPNVSINLKFGNTSYNGIVTNVEERRHFDYHINEHSFDSLSKDSMNIVNFIQSLNEPFELTIDRQLNTSLILESLLLALTDINVFKTNYQPPKVYAVFADRSLQTHYKEAFAKAEGYHLARVLNHLPFNLCNSQTLSDEICNLLDDDRYTITIYRKNECIEHNLNGILAVANSARYEPSIIKVEYAQGTGPKIGLVGKGIMFDSGGYNVKTGDFGGMKTDMAGSGAVIGTLKTLSTLNLDVNVVGYIMTTDNLINQNSYLPGDVITFANGVSVEIGNTDAEGRLVLADGLLLSNEDNCDVVIDIATLTGNSAHSLGKGFAPLYSTNPAITDLFTSLNYTSTDNVWPMPLPTEYQKYIQGNISDIRNTASVKHAGSIMAAVFLQYFAPDTNWVHIDMGAMSRREEFNTPVNGYGVRLLINFIVEYSK